MAVAKIASVDPGSPAWEAGFEVGDGIEAVDGHPLADILDWQWLTAQDECVISYVGKDGERGCVDLVRTDPVPWGITFADTVFDGVRTCKNACTFCFMHQLPRGLRRTLYVRDDDFRLSFMQGNFVTLTNLDAPSVERIIEQRISPLRVSLHAVDAHVRAALMGKHAHVGLRNLEALLEGGISVEAQIVLVPGANDGDVLDETLAWAYAHDGIEDVGIVPLGFTDHQSTFSASFDEPALARAVLERIEPFQERALAERGYPWVFAADEFYLNAYGDHVLDHLPPASFYGGFPLFEDGIGVVRSSVDDFARAEEEGAVARAAHLLRASASKAVLLFGCAMEPYAKRLFDGVPLRGVVDLVFVPNRFLGGNVDVTGLLSGTDMADAVREHAWADATFCLPAIAFNADGLTIDEMSAADIQRLSGRRVCVIPSNPLDCIDRLIKIAEDS